MIINNTVRTQRVQDIITALGSAGVIKFYSGAELNGINDDISARTLIATCTLSSTPATVANGVATFNAISDDLVTDATATIGIGIAMHSDGTRIFTGCCGVEVTHSPRVLNPTNTVFVLNSLAALAGGVTRLNSILITDGNKGNN